MPDLVVTVPRELWVAWIAEGDPAGSPESGKDWGYSVGWQRPPIVPGDRLYVVSHSRLRGYAPVTAVEWVPHECTRHAEHDHHCEQCEVYFNWSVGNTFTSRPRLRSGSFAAGTWVIVRNGGAVAVSVGPRHSKPEHPEGDTGDLAFIRGFRGLANRWWPREHERPFPDWRDRDLWLNLATRETAVEPAVEDDGPQLSLLGRPTS